MAGKRWKAGKLQVLVSGAPGTGKTTIIEKPGYFMGQPIKKLLGYCDTTVPEREPRNDYTQKLLTPTEQEIGKFFGIGSE